MTTGKTIALTRQAFVGKVMSLLFNILSSLVSAFPPIYIYICVCVCVCMYIYNKYIKQIIYNKYITKYILL